MKNLSWLVLSLAMLSGVSMEQPQSYPLVCRGGAGTLGYNTDQGGSAVFYFARTSGPAGAGLAPGQCAWVDRAVGQSEPSCVRQSNVSVAAAWIFPGNLGGSYFNSAGAPWLRSMLSSAQFQTFQAYNPGNNCFVVTRLGP